MIVVLFEVRPADVDAYLREAARLRPLLDDLPGFVAVERFRSLSDPQRLLSLSCWQDEAAVRRWREAQAHHQAQQRGRNGLLLDYRLRVAEVQRDYGLHDRAQVPLSPVPE